MNRDDITKLAKEAGFGNYAYEAAGIFERFAALVAAAEREKCTGTQEFVTLPREVAEQALEALINEGEFRKLIKPLIEKSIDSIRAALDQPQNHVPDAENMAPAGWKLVPVEPNCSMVLAGERSLEQHDFLRLDSAYRAMLDAAPKPPTVKECLTVEQPQAEQPAMTPIAQRKLEDLVASGYTISGYSIYHEQKHQHGFVTGAGLVGWWKPEGMEYPQPQVEREPDWSDSKTLPSELWKNPLLSLQERLQIADGAVQWNCEVAENLRARLCAAQQPLGEQEPVAWMVTSEMQDGTRSTYPMIGRFKDVQDCCDFGEPVPLIYQHPQPKREPLTDERIDAIADAMPGGLEGFMKGWGWRQFARAVLEATHNIK